ncbi:hypothetical protein CSA37_09435 [Candidatus Fermentibacteria bacterium]|nr:MAG: hypothetical protein CSA37_09435 [Candidatus Fermentibacteria bacterium]
MQKVSLPDRRIVLKRFFQAAAEKDFHADSHRDSVHAVKRRKPCSLLEPVQEYFLKTHELFPETRKFFTDGA